MFVVTLYSFFHICCILYFLARLCIFPLFMCSSFIAIQSIGVLFALMTSRWLEMLKGVPQGR